VNTPWNTVWIRRTLSWSTDRVSFWGLVSQEQFDTLLIFWIPRVKILGPPHRIHSPLVLRRASLFTGEYRLACVGLSSAISHDQSSPSLCHLFKQLPNTEACPWLIVMLSSCWLKRSRYIWSRHASSRLWSMRESLGLQSQIYCSDIITFRLYLVIIVQPLTS
jgi:hypothetical protein